MHEWNILKMAAADGRPMYCFMSALGMEFSDTERDWSLNYEQLLHCIYQVSYQVTCYISYMYQELKSISAKQSAIEHPQ